jgi:hypothetical protein
MDLGILDASMGQPMPGRGLDTQTVMSSTHQYPDKTMYEVLQRAVENDWPVFEWCWKESANPIDGWLAMETVDRKKPGSLRRTCGLWSTTSRSPRSALVPSTPRLGGGDVQPEQR